MVRFGLAKFLLTQRDRSGMWTCVWEESWLHPAVRSGLILFGVSFRMSFLIWGQAILNKQIQSRVPQSQRINPFTLPPNHKHHACHHRSVPNNLERRGDVRGPESTEAACGGSVPTAGHQHCVESPTGEWSDSALEKQKRVNT